MSQYKIGDRVVCIKFPGDNEEEVKLAGAVGEVVRVCSERSMFSALVKWNHRIGNCTMYAEEIELYRKEEQLLFSFMTD